MSGTKQTLKIEVPIEWSVNVAEIDMDDFQEFLKEQDAIEATYSLGDEFKIEGEFDGVTTYEVHTLFCPKRGSKLVGLVSNENNIAFEKVVEVSDLDNVPGSVIQQIIGNTYTYTAW